MQEKTVQRISDYAYENKAGGVGANVVASLLQGAGNVEIAKQNIKNFFTGEDRPVNRNSPAFIADDAVDATQEAITRDMGPVAKGATNIGLSLTQNGARMLMGKPILLANMALGAGASAGKSALERGGSASQALSSAVFMGAAELLGEKLPTDMIFKTFKNGVGGGIKNLVKSALKQAGAEATEETLTQIADRVGDNMIMGDKSEMAQMEQDLIAEGKTPKDARKAAIFNFFVKDPLIAGLGGAVSGGVMGGIAGISGNITQRKMDKLNKALEKADAIDLEKEQAQEADNRLADTAPASALAFGMGNALPMAKNVVQTASQKNLIAMQNRMYQAGKSGLTFEQLQEAAPDMIEAIGKPEAFKAWAQGQHSATAEESTVRTAQESTPVTQERNEGENATISRKMLATAQELGAAASHDDMATVFKKIGREGATALVENSDPSNKSYMTAFANYYSAGLTSSTDTTAQTARSSFAGDLAHSTQLAAYRAGVRDAQTIKNSVYFGQNSGFVRDKTYSKSTMTSDTANLLDGLAKSVGVKIVMADKILDSNGAEVRANASHANGVLTLSTSCNTPFLTAATHEFVHRLRETDPQSYNEVQSLIVSAMNATELARGIDTRVNLYSGATDTPPNSENMTEEVVGDALGQLLGNEEFYSSLPAQHRGTLQKLADFFHDLLLKIRKILSRGNASLGQEQYKEFTDLEKAVTAVETTIKAAISKADATNKMAETQANSGEISRRYMVDKNFASNVDTIVNSDNAKQFAHRQVLVGNTPQSLISVGFEPLPMMMTSKHIYLMAREDGIFHAQNDNYHGLGAELLKQLPNALESPICMFVAEKNSDRVVMLTQLTDAKDLPIIAVIEFAGNANINRISISTNLLASGYGKSISSLYNALRRAIADNRVLQADEKRSQTLPSGGRVQYPATLWKVDFNKNIQQFKENVKHKRPTIEQIEKAQNATKFSLQDSAELQRENARLNELNAHLREQMKISTVIKTDPRGVERIAKSFLRENSSSRDVSEFTNQLQEIYDFIANNGNETDDLTFATVHEMAEAAALSVLNETSILNDELYIEYKDLRKYLRDTPLSISQDHRNDLPNGYNEFRKKNFGRINLRTTGIAVDSAYMELSDAFPEFFNADETTNPADQLIRISEVLDALKPIYENIPRGELGYETARLARDILESFYTAPQQMPTFADRQQKKLTLQKIIGEKQRDALLRKQLDLRETAVRRIKEHYQSKESTMRERQARRTALEKIRRHVKTLSNVLLRPSGKRHIPEELRYAIADFIASLDFKSDRQNATTHLRLDALQNAYRDIVDGKDNIYMDVDPDLIDNIAEIKTKSRPVALLSLQELETLWRVIRAVEKSITNANKLFREGKFKRISDLGESFIENNAGQKQFIEKAGMGKKMGDLLNLEMLQPYDFFHEFGQTGDELFLELWEAQNVKIERTKELAAFGKDLLQEEERKEWGGAKAELTTFTGAGGSVQLTGTQKMSLYLLSKRKQAREHILQGGIRPAPITKKTKLGTKVIKSYEPIVFTPEVIADIASSLTARQKEVADKIGAFMSGRLSEWGNETSLQMYGYKKFNEENYFPIKVDSNYLKSELSAGKDTRVKNMGFTKATIQHANNPVIIEDIFDVFTRHADDMGTYNAFAGALEDVERVYNFTARDKLGARTGSVKQTIERTIGTRGHKYFQKLMQDINAGIRSENSSKLMGNYKAASVGLNTRVALQQPTAIIRATAIIDPKYIAMALKRSGNWDYVCKHSPIAAWKNWGYFQTDTGRQMKDIILDKKSSSEYTMALAGFADNITWAWLYRSVEAEISATTPLANGSAEFYEAVNARFDYIVMRTQVVDSVLLRSDIMRESDNLRKMATAFMAEPTKSYNLLRSSFRDVKVNKGDGSKARAARALIAFAFTAVATALMASLADALRDDDDDETYNEKYSQAFSENIADNFNPLAMLPYAKDILSMLQGYDVKRMDMTAISDTIKSAQAFTRAMQGTGDKTAGWAAVEFVSKASKVLGIPLSNLKRELESLLNGALLAANSADIQTSGFKFKYDMLKIPLNKGKPNYWIDMEYNAEQRGDSKAAIEIHSTLISIGVDEKDIDARKRHLVKQGADFLKNQSATADSVITQIQGTTAYAEMPQTYQEKASDTAKAYADAIALLAADPQQATGRVEIVNRIKGGADAGLEPWEYILYDTALKMAADKDNKKGITQDEVVEAMNKMDWLTQKERDYLFMLKYAKGGKNNPYN